MLTKEQETQLRSDLRNLAIRQHERPAYGGTFVDNGFSCEVCKGTWGQHEPEFHAVTCSAVP